MLQTSKTLRTWQKILEVARNRNGKCLTKQYLGLKEYHTWQCEKHHTWQAWPSNVIYCNKWCPYCAGNAPLTIEEMNEVAEGKGGKCLSSTYEGESAKLQWQCGCDYKWWATPHNVKHHNRWCPKCSNSLPVTIDRACAIAQSRGGKCLSSILKRNTTKLLWQCSKGHEWKASFANVQDRQSWCPHCVEYRTEEECRKAFEDIFHLPFPRKPRFLDKKYELDGYCEELMIAFEYNGEQHYRRIPHWHRSLGAFRRQQDRDKKKVRLCTKLGIKLIIIPYYESKNPKKFIQRALEAV